MFKKLRDCSIQVNHNSIEHGNYVKICFLRLLFTTLLMFRLCCNYWTKCTQLEKKVTAKNYIRSTYQSRYVLLYDEYTTCNASQFVFPLQR